jgi:hypothetical protein
MSRRGTLIWIHLYLVVQLGLPAWYYFRDDKYDERFAWRMFSTIRASRCSAPGNLRAPPEFTVDGQPVRIESLFHEAWVGLTRRARPSVLHAMGKKLCRDNPGRAVAFRYVCIGPDAKPETAGVSANLCEARP